MSPAKNWRILGVGKAPTSGVASLLRTEERKDCVFLSDPTTQLETNSCTASDYAMIVRTNDGNK